MENWSSLVWAMIWTILVLTPLMLSVLSPFLVRKLAEAELFVATVNEGQARAVIFNQKFDRFIMSYSGYCFQGELVKEIRKDQEEYWEVVKDTRIRKKTVLSKLFEGIHFIGIPPFAQIQRYRMTWIEWGYPKKSDGTVEIEKAPIPHDETISHILVQSDIYFVRVLSAETKEGVPFDVGCLLTIRITNPYKAQYRVQHWLELVTNQTEGSTRIFIGVKEAVELFTTKDENGAETPGPKAKLSPTCSEELEGFLKTNLDKYKHEYGVTVEKIQIQSIEPAGPESEKYRDLLTKKYEAQQEAQRVRISADADAYRIRAIAEAERMAVQNVIGAVAQIPGGDDIFHSQKVGGLKNLQTYVEGRRRRKGDAVVAIPTNTNKE